MIPVSEAVAKVVAGVRLLPAEQVALPDALGRVLAEDVASRVTHPPVAVSSMDGYAVRAADVAEPGTTLTRVGESAAGGGFEGTVEAGQCVRIFTGAPLPSGADAVEMQENTSVDGDAVTFEKAVPEGRFVRPAGLDFEEGKVLLEAGRLLTARDLGLMAGMDIPWVRVRRRPRVAVLANGNELVMPGDPRTPSQILSSNSVAVAAYVRALGGEAVDLGIASDDEDAIRAALDGAKGADLLITIGGASVGDYDFIRKVLGDEGMDLEFHRIAMRPGKPFIFGRLGDVPVMGLPGNPVSAGATSVVLLRPAMRAMLGLWDGPEALETVLVGRDLPENDQRQDYLRATLSVDPDGHAVATPFEKQDSAMMAKFAAADCLVVRPPHAPAAAKGERVQILRLRDGMVSL